MFQRNLYISRLCPPGSKGFVAGKNTQIRERCALRKRRKRKKRNNKNQKTSLERNMPLRRNSTMKIRRNVEEKSDPGNK